MATEKQIKEHLKVGVSKARLIITKHSQQPEKCFSRESFLAEVQQIEGVSEWVEGGLISFGPSQMPKSKKPQGTLRKPRKTSMPISEKPERTSSTQISPPLTSPEGEGQGEGQTRVPLLGVMDPSLISGGISHSEGIPQESVPVPMTPLYTPYQQPPVPHGFGFGGHHGLISPRGDGLGASPINPSGNPRFPAYTIGQSTISSQQFPTGFNPQTPWGPPRGFPRGPPPEFWPRYPSAALGMGEGTGAMGNGYGEDHTTTPDEEAGGLGNADNKSPEKEVSVPEDPEANPNNQPIPTPEEVEGHEDPQSQVPVELPNGGMTPDKGPHSPLGSSTGGMTPNNGGSPSTGDNNAEIEVLHQHLAQAQEALAKSNQALQQRTAQDSQINKLRELVHKQQGDYESAIKGFQEREQRWEREQYEAAIERQKDWEEER